MSQQSDAGSVIPYNGPPKQPKSLNLFPQPQATYNEALGEIVADKFQDGQNQFPIEPRLVEGAQFPAEKLIESEPPANPDMASSLAELERSNRELREAFEAQRAESDALRLEMQLQARLGQVQPQLEPLNLPKDFDPSQTLTAGQLARFMQQVIPELRGEAHAQAIRAAWTVTPEQESEIRTRFPQATSLPEPQRTQFIREAAQRMYRNQTPRNAPAKSEGRMVERTVPLESSAPPQSLSEPRSQDKLEQFRREYLQAQKLKNPKERLAALRDVAMREAKARGLKGPELPSGSFET